jgi:L-seryl-tRNA(Ser) seleniumtransferase
MGRSVYDVLGVEPVVNARGCCTIIGGTLMAPATVQAMAEAAEHFVRLDELQAAGSALVSEVTGAEAGYLTSGAAAGIAMSTAAVLAGLDTDRLNALPRTSGADEVVMQRLHRNPYDHLVRAAGASLVHAGDESRCEADDLRRSISSRTVAAFFSASREYKGGLSAEAFIEVAKAEGLAVIVDASMGLPPVSNLRRFVAAGADFVCFSGGKVIRGPAASGFIACRAEATTTLSLINQDLDVAPATWTHRGLLEAGALTAVPDQGIARGMKIGKEEMVGLLVALRAYADRDHDAERRGWDRRLGAVTAALRLQGGVRAYVEEVDGRPVPVLHLAFDRSQAALEVVAALASRSPRVVLDDHRAAEGVVRISPECLTDDDVPLVAAALNDALATTETERAHAPAG